MELLFGCFLGGVCVFLLLVAGALYAARTSSQERAHPSVTPTYQTYDSVAEDWNTQSEAALNEFMETLSSNQRKEKN